MKALLITAVAASVAGSGPAPAVCAAASCQPSLAARIAAMAKDRPRVKGPGLTYAMQLAQAALAACRARGGTVSVLVTDAAGIPVVLLSGDGAGERSQLITQTKANTVIRYRMSSTDVKRRTRTDPALAREIALDPNIGEARLGAFPLLDGGELIGALSVSGLTGGDDACAQDAMAKVPMH